MDTPLTNVVIEVLDKRFKLGELTVEDLPLELMKTDIGNPLDPIGQISSWLWNNIEPLIRGAEEYLWGKLRTVRDIIQGWTDRIYNYIYQTIKPVIDAVRNTVNNIWSKVQSLPTGLSTLLSSLSTSISNLKLDFSGFTNILNTIWNTIRNLPSSITSAISSTLSGLTSTITNALSPITSAITNVINIVKGIPSTISSLLSGITSALSQIPNTIISGIQSFFTSISKTLAGLPSTLQGIGQSLAGSFTQVYEFLSGIGLKITQGFTGFQNWLTKGLADLGLSLQQVGGNLVTFFKDIPSQFTKLYSWLQGGWDELTKGLDKWWKDAQVWWGEQVENIEKSTHEVQMTLSGFVNPLIDIKNKFDSFVGSFTEFIKDPLGSLKGMFTDAWNWLKQDIFPVISKAFSSAYDFLVDVAGKMWDGIKGISHKIWDILVKGLSGVIGIAEKGFAPILDWMSKGLAGWLFTPFSMIPRKLFEDFEKEVGKIGDVTPEKLKTLQLASQTKLLHNLGTYIFSSIGSPYLVSNFLRFLGKNMKGKIKGSPFGVGGDMDIDVGSIFLHMSHMVWKMPDILLGSLSYGMGIWLYQPVAKLVNSMARNQLPIELPDLDELITISRRNMPFSYADAEGKKIGGRSFDSFLVEIYRTMTWHGYNDNVIDWYITKKDNAYVEVLDRFNIKRRLPTSLLYEIPTASELARMMVRDIFGKPEDPFPSFKKAIAMRGMVEDVAKMYYLLHFDYPPMDKLYEFACRCAVGMAWVSDTPLKEATDLGARGVSPISLNTTVSNVQGLKTHLNKWITTYLKKYAKWHDYAQFSWIDGFTSDGLVTMDMMADIPQRIDARWMYKWQVPTGEGGNLFSDQDMFKIITARGMHPNFIESISIAEMLNAFAEERNYARSGIMNVYERGFTTESIVESKLSDMVRVSLLGKDVSVKFLDGEKKLLILRHVWDRAYNILSKLWSNLTLGFQRNQLTSIEVMSEVEASITSVKACVGIDLEVDVQYLNCYLNTFEARKQIENIQRLRYWMRIFIYRATQLAESGEEFEYLINNFVKQAKLTDQERDLMVMLGKAFITVAERNKNRSIIQKIVKSKMKRGEWSFEQSLAELLKSGMSKGEATAFLESEARVRTFSIDNLISMSENVPIDIGLINRKMDIEGVPPDEKKLYIAKKVGTELNEEMNSLVTELVNQYIATDMSVQDLRSKLNEVATLKGTVKTKYGVDWINISPEETDLIVERAILRRARATGEDGITVSGKKLTSLHLVGATENIPISTTELKARFIEEGYSPIDQRILMDESLARSLSEEMHKIATELVTDMANGMITEAQLKTSLDNLATLGGSTKTLIGRDWIVLDPIERQLLISLAKLKRARAIAK